MAPQTGRESERAEDAVGSVPVGVVIGVVVVYGALAAWSPVRSWFDDPYFYLQIARNLLAGEGATFHGLGWTNGYHPLWLLTVVPLAALAELTSTDAQRWVTAAQALLAVGSGAGLVALMRRMRVPHPALPLAVAAVALLGGALWGSEGWLAVALQVGALLLWVEADDAPREPRRWAAAGAVLGLAVLARLDLVFFAAAVVAVTALQPGGALASRARNAAWMGGAIAVVLLPYLVANFVASGHVMPVSGAVKGTFPWPDLVGVADKLGTTGRNAGVGALLALASGRACSGAARSVLTAVGGGALVHLAYVALFTGSQWSTDYDYYWTTGQLALALSVGVLYAGLARWLPSFDAAALARLGAGLAGLLLLLGLTRVVARVGEPEPPTVRLGAWLAANTPEDAVVFAADAPGRLAWFSRRRVFAIDGLTWDYRLSEVLRARGGERWLDDLGTTHLVVPRFDYDVPWLRTATEPGGVTLHLRDPWTREEVGRVALRSEHALVVTTSLGAEADDDVGVWKR